MTNRIFTPTNILLPEGISMEKWSVVACDQFSSEQDYWERVKDEVGQSPSTLNMIIPEAYLDEIDEETEKERICAVMDDYLSQGIFREIGNSFIFIKRTQSDGHVRHGIVGAIDLEEYDFSRTDAAIRASEGTVLDRLPPRIRVRRAASLELPHIMTFIDDPENIVLGPLAKKADSLPLLYDFTLMEGGGNIRGMRVTGDDADNVMESLGELHLQNDMLMAVGDGNHSLAAAKVYWDEIKTSLDNEARVSHPARWALVETNNVYDDAITFEAIHRIVFDADPADFASAIQKAMPSGDDYELVWIYGERSGTFKTGASCIGDMLSTMQEFLDDYTKKNDCRIDYIHGEESVRKLAQSERSIGLILPAMEKSEFFSTVTSRGVFPKKSFSVGEARDKRYYLECRKINGR